MVQLAAEQGIALATATDAHNTREFGVFTYHEMIFAQAGLSDDEVAGLLYRPGQALPL